MKSLTLLALSLAGVAQSHYIFTTFSAGGTSAVRKNINNNSPITNLADPNLRCNAGGATGGSAQTVPVAAGSRVSFSADTPVYHQGPTSLYMTKVPSAAAADGSTPWFKIKDFGAKTGAGQASFDMASKSEPLYPSSPNLLIYLPSAQHRGHRYGAAMLHCVCIKTYRQERS